MFHLEPTPISLKVIRFYHAKETHLRRPLTYLNAGSEDSELS